MSGISIRIHITAFMAGYRGQATRDISFDGLPDLVDVPGGIGDQIQALIYSAAREAFNRPAESSCLKKGDNVE